MQPAHQTNLDRLGGIVVAVPDPAATAGFLRDGLGFHTTERDDGWVASCFGDYGPNGQEAITLIHGKVLRLEAIAFEVPHDDALQTLHGRLEAIGVETAAGPSGLRFADPAGNPLACVVPRAIDVPHTGPLCPRRLGHVNLKAPDPTAAARFYEEVLGMRRSEQIGENLYFLRIGSEHHNIGLRPGGHGELHHAGFEMGGWHEYQPLLDHLAEQGLTVEYGPGRHRPGNNIFTYLCDPSSGLRIELFADMAQVVGDSYVAPRWEAGDRMTKTINRWGPLPPESFLA